MNQEPYYKSGSSDNMRSYAREYDLNPEYQASSIYGLTCDSNNCVILAGVGYFRSKYGAQKRTT